MSSGGALEFMQKLISADIPMFQNSQSYNSKNPSATPALPGKKVALVLYHPPLNAYLPLLRKRGEGVSQWNCTGQQDVLSAENALHLSSSGGRTLARLSAVNTHVQGLPLSTNTKPFKVVPVTFQICFLFATAMQGCAQWGPLSVRCLCRMKRNSSNKILRKKGSFGNRTFLDFKFLLTEGHFVNILV